MLSLLGYRFNEAVSRIGGVYITQILPFADKKSLPLHYEFERAFHG